MRTTLIGLSLLALFPLTAQAQTGRHVALGASIGFRELIDDHFKKKNPSFSALYRLSRHPSKRKQGWVWRLGGTASYAHTDFDMDLGGTDTKIGSLRTIPVMGGVERAYRHQRIKVGLSLLAGPSFNNFSIDNSARAAYEAQLGAPLEDIKVKNSFAVRSGVGVWYDVSRWVGVHAGIYYQYDRPRATITAGGNSSSETWKTDRVSLSTGLAVGIF
jgi:hypothetical protein